MEFGAIDFVFGHVQLFEANPHAVQQLCIGQSLPTRCGQTIGCAVLRDTMWRHTGNSDAQRVCASRAETVTLLTQLDRGAIVHS